MSERELWIFACGLREGHVRIAGPWKRWQANGASGNYRPTWDGGVAVRTNADGSQWGCGSAAPWQPGCAATPAVSRLNADAWLRSNGWLLCDGDE